MQQMAGRSMFIRFAKPSDSLCSDLDGNPSNPRRHDLLDKQ